MPRVFIPAQLRSLTAGQTVVEAGGRTIGQLIRDLDARFPGLAARLERDGALAPGLAVSVDGALTPRGLLAPLEPHSEVHFLPAMGGG